MGILVNKNTRLIVQGITGHEGLLYTQRMLDANTVVVAGVSPGRGGEWVLGGKIPVFDSMKLAVEATEANTSVIFVPARYAADAMYEAVDAGIKLIVTITEGVPIQDMMRVRSYLDQKDVRLIGPNCPGILAPSEATVGIFPDFVSASGNIGVVSRCGTLTFEVLLTLKNHGAGITTCVGIGGDPICGSSFTDILEMFENDPKTEKVVLLGEIGGSAEERAAEYISSTMSKPVVAYIAGQSAPIGKRMGHAGAIIEGKMGLAKNKILSLQAAGVKIARHPEEIPVLL